MKQASKAKLIALMVLLVSGVATAQADENTSAQAGDASRGAKAWSENCMRCHNMRYPSEFRDDLWKPIVYHMRIRAGLTGQQTRDILEFIQNSN